MPMATPWDNERGVKTAFSVENKFETREERADDGEKTTSRTSVIEILKC